MKSVQKWFVYMAECKDGSLYTGYARDVEQRILVHNSGKGARYTRSRRPVSLVWYEEKRTKRTAMRREAEIKSWTRSQKKKLIKKI